MSNQISLWKGRPLDELSREELIAALNHCGIEIMRLKEDRDRWREAGDVRAYLRNAVKVTP